MRRSLPPLLLPVVLCLPFAHPAIHAQTESLPDEPETRFEGEVRVSEVLLDVLVTDTAGNVVLGLGEDDFVVEDEGRPVPVESVSFYSNRTFLGGLGDSTPGGTGAPQDRYFVLFFYRPPVARAGPRDSSLYLKLPQAGRMSFQWMVEDLLPNDHVAVVSYGMHLDLHHDFSRDRDRLGRATLRAAQGKAPPDRWPSRVENPEAGVSLAELFERTGLDRETEDLHKAVEVLAEALGEVTGRKNLILFGADFPRLASDESRKGYPPMVRALNAHNVAVYGLSVTGRGRQPSLAQLAEDTGGQYAYGFASFLDPLRTISVENSGYYLVSFRSEFPASETGYREVSVRTVNEDFRVRTRNGYEVGD